MNYVALSQEMTTRVGCVGSRVQCLGVIVMGWGLEGGARWAGV